MKTNARIARTMLCHTSRAVAVVMSRIGGMAGGALLLVLLWSSGSVLAQEYWFHERSIERTNAAHRISPLKVDDMFGDHHSMYDGSVEFNNSDIHLPGNNDLPVELRRTFRVENRFEHHWIQPGENRTYPLQLSGFGDWDVDVPHLSGVFLGSYGWTTTGSDPNKRCTTATAPRATPGRGPFDSAHTFWYGYNLHVPGQLSEKLLKSPDTAIPSPTNGINYPWITKSMWRVSCVATTANGYAGESFVAVSTEGVKYFLDHVIVRDAPEIIGVHDIIGGNFTETRRRVKIFFVATRVEDRFGNWVNYQWSGDRLTQISANDGRQINISYNSLGRVVSASSGGGQWQYSYSQSKLSSVTLPDASKWSYVRPGFSTFVEMETIDDWTADCPSNYDGLRSSGGPVVVTHPSGATAEFSFQLERHSRSGTPFHCNKPATWYEYLEQPNYSDVFTLVRKRVTGPGLAPMEWNYTYSYGSEMWFKHHCDAGDVMYCPESKVQTILGPEGTWERIEYGIQYDVNEGQLLRREVGSGPGNILRTESYAYVSQSEVANHPFPDSVGINPQIRSNPLAEIRLRPLKTRTIHQQGVSFTKNVNSFDVFARPLSTAAHSTLAGSPSLTIATTYEDNLAFWTLGQVKAVRCMNSVPTSAACNGGSSSLMQETVYDSTWSLPTASKEFGKPTRTLTWDTTSLISGGQRGTVKTVADGNGNVTTLGSWKRGIPQAVVYPATAESPAGSTKSAVVNDRGWITSETDEVGSRTCYAYDPMGRINKITYPSETQANVCDTSKWAATTISFAAGNPAAYGMPAGHWRQTTLTGNARRILILDALWRPVVEQTLDLANVAGTVSEVINRYDASGRKIFHSYPMRTNGAATYTDPSLKGTFTTYDALDRIRTVKQDWEGTGQLTTTTDYLVGFKTRVTDPRGSQTTTEYMVFDQPATDWPIRISHPGGTVTDISRDIFGKPREIMRSGPAP